MRYFKQYGAKRTGTNYLRSLLEKNFDDITVLMHTLGGKHGTPVDLFHYLSKFSNDYIGFTEAASAAVPAENSLPFNDAQRTFMKLHASALAEAVKKQQLHFLISVKNPYAWINSMFKFHHLKIHTKKNRWMAAYSKFIIQLCTEYNVLYKSYWEHFQQFPQQTSIIEYDELLANPHNLLQQLQQQLQLVPSSPKYTTTLPVSLPTDWDNFESIKQSGKNEFNKEFYFQHKYFDELNTEVITIMNNEIDWNIAKLYGYTKADHS